MKKIVFLVLFVFIIIFSETGYIDSYSTKNLQSVLVIYSSEDSFCKEVYENTITVLVKNNIFYADFDLSKNYALPALDNFPIVLITTEVIYHLSKGPQSDIKDYVKNGGKVIQLLRGYSEDTAPIFGITNVSEPQFIDPVEGVKFEKDLFPGLSGLAIPPNECFNVSYSLSLNNNVSIIARSYNGLPLAWETHYGRGKTIFWNATFLSDKTYRGLIISSITSLLDISARRVIGSSIIYIDDMPAPSWNVKLEPIKSEYDISDTEYYLNVFLPDMINLGNKYNIKYTTATIFNYNALTKPPFTFYDWDNTSIIQSDGSKIITPEKIFNTLVEEEAEVGFHGYNHIPFTLSDWSSQKYMREAILASRKKWFSITDKPPRIYVPPMNVNDREGFNQVMEVFPEIEVYASLYPGVFDEGCDREFGRDPWNENIVSIPRVTAGYIIDGYQKFLALSTLEAFGVWTHFLHSDDIFSNPKNYPDADQEWIRNPDSIPWKGDKSGGNGLYYRFEKELKSIKNLYPWISFDTALTAKDKILDYADDSTFINVFADSIDLRDTKNGIYIIELPYILELEKNKDFTILYNEKYGEKRRIILEVKNGCKIYFKAS